MDNKLNCYKHKDRVMYDVCEKCKKNLCEECAKRYLSGLCEECEQERLRSIENINSNTKKIESNNKKINYYFIVETCIVINATIMFTPAMLLPLAFFANFEILATIFCSAFEIFALIISIKSAKKYKTVDNSKFAVSLAGCILAGFFIAFLCWVLFGGIILEALLFN